jgi:hypothetical protein
MFLNASAAEPADEVDRGRHTGLWSFNVIAGGPGSLSLSFGAAVWMQDTARQPGKLTSIH